MQSSENAKQKDSLMQQTVKNAGWNFATSLATKIGGLIFTIILARMLLPELFGAYNLVLSLVVITFMLTNLGIGNATVRYLSEYVGKNQIKKARSYFRYFIKIKSALVIFAILVLITISRFLSYNIFNKPLIFVPILFSCLYIFAYSLSGLFRSIFVAKRDLFKIFILEVSFEVSKIIFTLLAIFYFSSEFAVSGVFIALALASFFTFFINLILLRKNKDFVFGEKQAVERRRVFSYLQSMSLVSLSLVFFGSIDTLMLGYFVEAEFIGFYRASLSLVTTVAAFFGLGTVLLPLFTQIHNNKFEKAFEKVSRYLFILVIPAFVGLAIVAKYFILAIYGKEYLLATSSLYVLAPIIAISPFVVLYSSIFQAQEKTNILARAVLISLAINIILNYVFIKSFLSISGPELAIVGAGLATLISRSFYLSFLSIKSKQLFKTKLPWKNIFKSIFATLIMAGFLIWFSYVVDMNLYFGILEIILGIGIYFAVLFLIKGFNKEDLKLLKGLVEHDSQI